MTQVGTISANGDTEIGQLIARAMERVGKEGVITVAVRLFTCKPYILNPRSSAAECMGRQEGRHNSLCGTVVTTQLATDFCLRETHLSPGGICPAEAVLAVVGAVEQPANVRWCYQRKCCTVVQVPLCRPHTGHLQDLPLWNQI
jgi:hypothetical protein